MKSGKETELKKHAKSICFSIILTVVLMLISIIPAWAAEKEGEKTTAVCEMGVAYMERMGLGFTLKEDTTLKNGDILETKISSRAAIKGPETEMVMNEKTEMTVKNVKNISVEMEEGELFAVVEGPKTVKFGFQEKEIFSEKAVLLVSVHIGSANVSILSGNIKLGEENYEAGKSLSYSGDELFVSEVNANSLNAFAIDEALKLAETAELCISKDELQKIADQRQTEIQKAYQDANTEEVIEEYYYDDSDDSEPPYDETETQPDEDVTSPVEPEEENEPGEGNISEENISDEEMVLDLGLYCTIEIRCDTILNNMDDLTVGKDSFVPANGTILATSTMEFTEGETVFEVLTRACSLAGIQIEYSWTPMYNSYYIEGINNLYEFDCGQESGWMYKVNGWFPNYGCSSYTLKDGDTIVWCYTCQGLGADVGGSVY